MENHETYDEPRANEPGPAAPSPRPPHVRRVGTFTFGLVLIGLGVVLLLRSFLPALDLGFLRLAAPVLLVVLGIEVLVYASRPDVKLKYDWFSILISLLVLACAGGAAAAGSLWEVYGPDRVRAENRLSREAGDQVYSVLDALPAVKERVNDLSVSIDLDALTVDAASATLADCHQVALYLTFLPDSADGAQAFAADCKAVMDGCAAAGIPIAEFSFDNLYSGGGEDVLPTYSLSIAARLANGISAETLAGRVETRWQYDGNSYDTQKEATNEWMDASLDSDALEAEYRETFHSDPEEDYYEAYGEYPSGHEELAFMAGRLGVSLPATAESAAPVETASEVSE